MQSTTWELASRSIRLVDCSLVQAQCSNSTTPACVPNGYRSWGSRTGSKLRSFAAAVEWAAFSGGLFLAFLAQKQLGGADNLCDLCDPQLLSSRTPTFNLLSSRTPTF